MPNLTVHGIDHLDALWEMASSVTEDEVNINPAEAFVLGASILIHDAAMSVAAYPNGLSQIKETKAFKDAVACRGLAYEDAGKERFDVSDPPKDIIDQVLPGVLRALHAEHAETLAEQEWPGADGSPAYLIEDSDLRTFYGPTIGKIAHSHWWPVQKLEQEFSSRLGAFPNFTQNCVDTLKLACLLRIADVIHLDASRAPRFLRAITQPSGDSALHWTMQERMARPYIEGDAVVFTTGKPFGRGEAKAWWLAHDMLKTVHNELNDVSMMLQEHNCKFLKARRVKGIGSPETLAQLVETKGWRPVDARFQASDIHGIVDRLGGSKLYGNDPTVALRELIQNAADAVQARRKFQERPNDWGNILVEIQTRVDGVWLIVEDDGIGMSEQVLTGPLLDFGMSFWRSPLATEEFPGLMAAGMNSIGRFGIGFFSVFMLGSVVRVYSRRCDMGQDTGRLLEFSDGTFARPNLSSCTSNPVPIDGGTRVEVKLNSGLKESGGLLETRSGTSGTISLESLVAAIAPCLDVTIFTKLEGEQGQAVVQPSDWLEISETALLSRLNPVEPFDFLEENTVGEEDKAAALMRPIIGSSDQRFGRAFIAGDHYLFSDEESGWVTVSGLRAAPLDNIRGVLLGEALTASRNSAKPLASAEAIANWATEQAELIADKVEKDERRQARCAEVVLECGGRIGDLMIVQWGSKWMKERDFEQQLRSRTKLVISFDGDFHYDGDRDHVSSIQFMRDFELLKDVAVVQCHRGSILTIGNSRWPGSLFGNGAHRPSNLEAYVTAIVKSLWGDGVEEIIEEGVVGTVAETDIWRELSVFHKPDHDC
ncbi:MAG: ATP-binding protein [Albidovulum sp.]|nr:ATP-binding protein [Albidovulum sp.]